jgi:hypothetical protein
MNAPTAWMARDNLAAVMFVARHDWQPPTNADHPAIVAFAARLGRKPGAVCAHVCQLSTAHPDFTGTPMAFSHADKQMVEDYLYAEQAIRQ